MRILAIDTTTEACSVALWSHGVIYTQFEKCFRNHTQRILPLIKKILDQSNMTISDLDALAFSRGPGNFTGIRINIGIVQGLAIGRSLPIISISTLITMAQGIWRKTGSTQVLTTINARMGEVYWAEYIRDNFGIWHGEKTEKILKLDAINHRIRQLTGKWTIVGTNFLGDFLTKDKISNLKLLNSGIMLPEAEDMLPIACHFLSIGRIISIENAKPIYLHDEIIWKKSTNLK